MVWPLPQMRVRFPDNVPICSNFNTNQNIRPRSISLGRDNSHCSRDGRIRNQAFRVCRNGSRNYRGSGACYQKSKQQFRIASAGLAICGWLHPWGQRNRIGIESSCRIWSPPDSSGFRKSFTKLLSTPGLRESADVRLETDKEASPDRDLDPERNIFCNQCEARPRIVFESFLSEARRIIIKFDPNGTWHRAKWFCVVLG